MMHLAIAEAKKGSGFVQINPLVGAVLESNGKVLAKGYHSRFGGPHAEAIALKKAVKKYSKQEIARANLYVTLEPCTRRGKTLPCLPSIKQSGIKNIFIGTLDPNPGEQGRSIRALRRIGCSVKVGIEQEECDYLIRTFRKWITTKKPFLLGKVGMSLDGKVTHPDEKRYITNTLARDRVHKLRQEFDAIMLGVNTVIRDDPELTTRLPGKRVSHPMKIILDSRLRVPSKSKALDYNTIVVCLEGVTMKRKRSVANTGATILELPPEEKRGKQLFEQMNMQVLMKELGRRKISSVVLEGGSYVFTTFINRQAIDEFYIFTAPQLFGATSLPFTYALQYTVSLQNMKVELIPASKGAEVGTADDADNLLVRGYAKYN